MKIIVKYGFKLTDRIISSTIMSNIYKFMPTLADYKFKISSFKKIKNKISNTHKKDKLRLALFSLKNDL